MKMGVKEFRERFSKLAEGDEPIYVTKNGRVIGRFLPSRSKPAEKDIDIHAWAQEMREIRDRWRAETPNRRQLLAEIGLDEDGEPIEA